MTNQILTSINYEQFLKDVTDSVIKALPPSTEQQQTITEDIFISREETAKLLGVCLGSIHNFTKDGRLKKYEIGETVRYKRIEVLKALKSK